MSVDTALRPTRLAEYIGQPALVASLNVRLAAARARGERVLPHVLLHGPGGLGKSTLAFIIANEMGGKAHIAMGPGIEEGADVYALLQQLSESGGDVLFIDEVHRLKPTLCEILYTAMEDGLVYYPVQTAQGVKPCKIVLPAFTLIGATTEPELLPAPLRMRFGCTLALQFYAPKDLAVILKANAAKLGVSVDDRALLVLSQRARGTPRVANHLLRFARDLASIDGTGITAEVAERSLTLQQIDAAGLHENDRQYLRVIRDVYGGGPVGAQALAATIGCSTGTVSSVIEPYMLGQGFVLRTHRGRKITDKALKHLAAYDAAQAPAELFAA